MNLAKMDLTGEWTFHGQPWSEPCCGRIHVDLRQDGNQLAGTLIQEIAPNSGSPPENPEQTEADVIGEIIQHETHPLVILRRINIHNNFKAVFAGSWDESVQTIKGSFHNTNPGGGTFVMERKC